MVKVVPVRSTVAGSRVAGSMDCDPSAVLQEGQRSENSRAAQFGDLHEPFDSRPDRARTNAPRPIVANQGAEYRLGASVPDVLAIDPIEALHCAGRVWITASRLDAPAH